MLYQIWFKSDIQNLLILKKKKYDLAVQDEIGRYRFYVKCLRFVRQIL